MNDLVCAGCQTAVRNGDRFCPECGFDQTAASLKPASIPATDLLPPRHVGVALTSVPVRLEVRLGQTLRTGAQGILELQILSQRAAETLQLEFETESSFPLEGGHALRFAVPPGGRFPFHQKFQVVGEGRHDFTFRLQVDSGGGESVYQGHFTVEVAAAAPGTQIIHFTDARRIEGRVVVGTEGPQLHLGGTVPSAESSGYVEVALLPRQRLEELHVKRILRGYESRHFPASKLCLSVKGPKGIRNIGLISRRVVTFGRSRENDVVLRVFPDNDEQSRLISRRHATLSFAPHGAFWKNDNCSLGTLIDGSALPAGEASLLKQRATIRPADALGLRCELFGDVLDAGPAYARFEKAFGLEPGPEAVGKVHAVRFRRLDGLAEREEYVLLQRAVAVGSGSDCAVRLPDASVSPLHAQVLWLAGSFWLEPCQSGRPTLVDGHPIPLDRLVPLRPGLPLRLGDLEMTVTRFQQYGVDVALDPDE